MPPQKSAEDGEVKFHMVHAPLGTPLAFVSTTALCYMSGNSVCLLDITQGTRKFLHTTAYGITKLAGCAVKGLVAFCEGGTSPHVFVYSIEPPRLRYTLSNVTELELADLAFSRDGSRLYTLSRATSKRLIAFSTVTGEKLKGLELALPLRFDKVSVFPGHKDQIALVRSSSVRIVAMQKSYETYICKLHPSSIPTDVDIAISAFSWTPSGHFLFATRQGALITLDGQTGAMLHSCQASQPITSLSVSLHHVVTAHIGNQLKFWHHDPAQMSNDTSRSNGVARPMEGPSGRPAVYTLSKAVDLQQTAMRPEERMCGQVAHVQVMPQQSGVAVMTAEGEVWTMKLPTSTPEEAADTDVMADDLDWRLLAWFHTHPVTDVAILGPGTQICASSDEGGRLRIWELNRNQDSKGFRMLRFTSAITSLTTDPEGTLIVAGSDSGCAHVIGCEDWRRSSVLDTLRISEAGIAQLRSVTHTERATYVAALLFNHKVAIFVISFQEMKIRMLGILDTASHVTLEDMCFHTHDFKPEDILPPKLFVVGCQVAQAGSTEPPSPIIFCFECPAMDHDPSVVELQRDLCPMTASRLPSIAKPGDAVSAVASASKKAVAVGFADGRVNLYPIPTASGPLTAKTAPAKALATFTPHEQLVTNILVSPDGGLLLSASMDGSIRKSVVGNQEVSLNKVTHNPYNGGVCRIRESQDFDIIISTGGADGVLVWSDPQAAIPTPDPLPKVALVDDESMEAPVVDVDDRNTMEFKLWEPVTSEAKAAAIAAEAGEDPEVNAVATAQRKALILEIDTLRRKVRTMVELNEGCPDLEKIDRKDFCIDFEERDVIAAKTKERCDALRAQLERENHARQLTRDRLIKEFWDPMRTKGCMITSLMSNLSVSNYPERIVSEEERGVTRKLRMLRQIERLEAKMNRDVHPKLAQDVILSSAPFTTGKEQYIVNWWQKNDSATAEGKAERRSEEQVDGGGDGDAAGEDPKKEEGEESEEKKPKEGEGANEGELEDQKFLYEPFELLTNSRRRLQVHLLQSLAAEYRAEFNKLFENCQGDKRSILDQIKEKLTRMRSILGELQVEEDVPVLEMSPNEEAEAVLKVRDDEIKAEKFITEEEARRLAEIAAKEEERLRQLRENDAGQRALMQMMGGTLKTKKDLSALEIVLDREPWMDEIAVEDMTDLQRQALKEFEEKEKALMEEQDKYRKQLDAELKKLRLEVQELTAQFEGLLKTLHHERFAHDAKFFCQELYCVRLQLALLQNVEDNTALEQSTLDVQAAQEKLAAADAKLEAFLQDVAEKRERQDERVRHEREVASGPHFRQQFAQSGLEPESVTQLLQIFRRRKDGPKQDAVPEKERDRRTSTAGQGEKHSAADAESRAALGLGKLSDPFDAVCVGDPYPDLGTPGAELAWKKGNPEVNVDDDIPMDECPEGIEEVHFRKMNDLRRERLHAEVEVQKSSAVLQEMAGLLAHLERERDDAKAEYERLCSELDEHKALMDRELYDVELLFKLRQGQVEVPQAAVVTDYSDAVVIDTNVVESRNGRILDLGKDKVRILETTREFRKKLNLIQWEHKMLTMETVDLEERTKDVHMLRVTKGLQQQLKGGEEGRNKADQDLLERKIEHLNTTTAQKEQSLKKQYAMGSRATKMRKMENNMLENKLRELQQNVIQREHIKRLRAPQGGSASGGGANEGERPRIIGGGGRIEENEGAIRAAKTSFREVKTRQSLMDAAKKHTEEIDLLRKELDRLRQRTFPTFVQLHEDRPSNPDFQGI